jgi:Berberine and berberine like
VKNKYDPTNLFRHNQNIRPTVYRATVGAAAAAKYATISFWWHLLDSIPPHSELARGVGVIATRSGRH